MMMMAIIIIMTKMMMMMMMDDDEDDDDNWEKWLREVKIITKKFTTTMLMNRSSPSFSNSFNSFFNH